MGLTYPKESSSSENEALRTQHILDVSLSYLADQPTKNCLLVDHCHESKRRSIFFNPDADAERIQLYVHHDKVKVKGDQWGTLLQGNSSASRVCICEKSKTCQLLHLGLPC